MIKTIIKAHKFFMTEGLDFVTVHRPSYDEFTDSWFIEKYISPKDKKYIPIAYMKFMYYSVHDYLTSKHVKK